MARLPFFRPFALYLVVSGLLVTAVVAIAGIAVGGFFERYVLEHEEAVTIAIVENQARQHLAPDYFARHAAMDDAFAHFLTGLPGVFRIKVFDRTGTIVWSNEPRLVGQRFPGHAKLERALRGEPATSIARTKHAEHIFERTHEYVAETYVPIVLPPAPGVVGAIETYKDATALVLGVERTQRVIWTSAGLAGLLLWLALALVVHQAGVNEQRARRLLEEAHQRLAAILAGIADQMVIVDRDLHVVWHNAAAGQTAAAVIGRPCIDAFGAAGPGACADCPASRTLRAGTVERGLREKCLPSGERRYLDLVTAPLRDAQGDVVQVLEVARDITDLVRMERQVKEANQALVEAQARVVEKERLAAVGELIVGLHHEILNPLTGVLGALQVLKQAPDAPVCADAIVQAEAEVRKIERVVRSLEHLRRADGRPYVGATTMLDLGTSAAPVGPSPRSPAAS